MDRVEQSTVPVSFALVHVRECVVVLALLHAPCCGTAEVVFVCTLVAVHVVIFTIRVHTHAHVCVPDLIIMSP